MMRNAAFLGSVLVLVLGVAGCGGNRTNPSSATATPAVDSGSSSNVATGSVGDSNIFGEPDAGGIPSATTNLLAQRLIYFDFDKSSVRPEFNAILEAHGRYIAENPNVGVRFEGHADERGSREYNIGLGERRAQSVRRVVMLYGAGSNQLSTVSYGEERPVAAASNEDAWAENRRVEIVYTR